MQPATAKYTIKEKNLKSEIETCYCIVQTKRLNSIKEKNLKSEIETVLGQRLRLFASVAIKEKNLKSEIETNIASASIASTCDQREESQV